MWGGISGLFWFILPQWLRMLNTTGGITIPDLKLYYRAIVIKTAWDWYRDRQVDQWNSIDKPEMNTHTSGHWIFDKGPKTIQWKKDSIFNKWCWFNWRLACRRMQINSFLFPCTKLKSMWIKDLHIPFRSTAALGILALWVSAQPQRPTEDSPWDPKTSGEWNTASAPIQSCGTWDCIN